MFGYTAKPQPRCRVYSNCQRYNSTLLAFTAQSIMAVQEPACRRAFSAAPRPCGCGCRTLPCCSPFAAVPATGPTHRRGPGPRVHLGGRRRGRKLSAVIEARAIAPSHQSFGHRDRGVRLLPRSAFWDPHRARLPTLHVLHRAHRVHRVHRVLALRETERSETLPIIGSFSVTDRDSYPPAHRHPDRRPPPPPPHLLFSTVPAAG